VKLPEEKPEKRRWTDPIVLVPIITAIIAAIPAYVLLIQPALEETQSPSPEPTPEPTATSTPVPTTEPETITTTPPPDDATAGPGGMVLAPPDDATETTPKPSITVTTDKASYRNGEIVKISGNVSKPESGKPLRIDVYDPAGEILFLANGVLVYPNGRGLYSHDLHTDMLSMGGSEFIPGKYEVLVTYLNQSARNTFDLE
jgi:hypothetical protein